jgi:hypothetical protein
MFPEVNNVVVLAGAGSAIHVSLIPKTRLCASSTGTNNQQQLVKIQARRFQNEIFTTPRSMF